MGERRKRPLPPAVPVSNKKDRFWGLSENLSWLAQFGGQGFEDISALANLLLN